MNFNDILLIRILESLEHRTRFVPETPAIEGYTRLEIQHHCWLALKDGLITGVDNSDFTSPAPIAVPIGLTLRGRTFLDQNRQRRPVEHAVRFARETGFKFAAGLVARILLTLLLGLLAWLGYDLFS